MVRRAALGLLVIGFAEQAALVRAEVLDPQARGRSIAATWQRDRRRVVIAKDDDHWWPGFEQEGTSSDILGLAVYDSMLIAGGQFRRAGDVPVQVIAGWTGSAWRDLGRGMDNIASPCTGYGCFAIAGPMTLYHGNLIAAGNFETVNHGALVVNHIARWDGSTWHALGVGLGNRVNTATVYAGDLIAAGPFTTAGGQPANHIARWDGVAWHSLGTGTTGGIFRAIAWNGGLIVAGAFSEIGGVPAHNIARWDGSMWTALSDGCNDWVTSLYVFQGKLLVSGFFDQAGGAPVPSIATWDGTTWQGFGSQYITAYDFAIYHDKLIAGGNFIHSGHNIARWNGDSWESLGSGLSDPVNALAVYQGSLYVAGAFDSAGGKPSRYVARWDDVITAIEVQDLEASTLASGVELRWRLSADALRSVRGVQVQRAGSREGPYEDMMSTALTPNTWMSFVDATAQPGIAYWYRLLLVLQEGSAQTAGPIAILANQQTSETKLYPPRVAGDAVELRYTIGTARTLVHLDIFDPRGRLIRKVASGMQELGQHSQFWDARNSAGSRVARGVYFVHFSTDRVRATQKLVLGH